MNTPLAENELASIRQELSELRAQMAALRNNGRGNRNGLELLTEPAITDRRGMMKKMAGLAVGVAAVGLLQPKKARAADGDALIIGESNTGSSATTLLSSDLILLHNGSGNTAIFALGGAIGVQGTAGDTGGNGVQGDANFGTSAHGVEGNSTSGAGGAFTGKRSALFLSPGSGAVADPNVTAPSGAASGDLYRGSTNSSLWYRTSTGYRRVADATTAGALTAFAASSRFVNFNALAGGTTDTYQIGGTTVGSNTVPTEARAIIGRIADANPTGGGGNLLVGATNPPVGGVIAVVAGEPQNSFFFSALDATGKLYVRNTSPGGSVDVIIDIAGYYE